VRSLLHSGASETQFILFFSTASEAQVALHLADRLAVSPSVRIAVVCAARQNLLGRLRFVRFVKPAVTSLAPEMLDGVRFWVLPANYGHDQPDYFVGARSIVLTTRRRWLP
jgi:hypothetical protein